MIDLMDNLKMPPASTEAEQAVLGGLMLDNSVLGDVLDICTEADFYRRDHRIIFSAICDCENKGDPFDVVTLAERMDNSGELENIGGFSYLGSLAENVPSVANIKSYAKIVYERAVERRLATAANEIASLVFHSGGLSMREKMDQAESLLMGLTEDKTAGGVVRASEVLPGWLNALDERYNRGGDIIGIPTGFKDIDRRMLGLQNSDLIIIAGRPSMGKTTFAMNIVEHVALNQNKAVAVFSLEMSATQLIDRMVSSVSMVPLTKIRRAKLEDAEWAMITDATQKIRKAPIFIDDTAGITTASLRSRARRLKKQEDIGLIVIDYLQLMRHTGADKRFDEVSEISRRLKGLAKELNIPVIALSQLNRSLEQRPNKRPQMSDLRESGSLEQDPDVIIFIYRDEVYNENSPDKGTAEIIFRKQRNGEPGTERMRFVGSRSRFMDYTTCDEAIQDALI